MENENGKMAKGLMVGFIAGSVAGAVLALLYAPKSGKELRRDLIDKSDSLIKNADEYLTRAQRKAGDMFHEGKQRSENVIRTARRRAETLMSDVERIIADAS